MNTIELAVSVHCYTEAEYNRCGTTFHLFIPEGATHLQLRMATGDAYWFVPGVGLTGSWYLTTTWRRSIELGSGSLMMQPEVGYDNRLIASWVLPSGVVDVAYLDINPPVYEAGPPEYTWTAFPGDAQ